MTRALHNSYKKRWYVRGIDVGAFLVATGIVATALQTLWPPFRFLSLMTGTGFLVGFICALAHIVDSRRQISHLNHQRQNAIIPHNATQSDNAANAFSSRMRCTYWIDFIKTLTLGIIVVIMILGAGRLGCRRLFRGAPKYWQSFHGMTLNGVKERIGEPYISKVDTGGIVQPIDTFEAIWTHGIGNTLRLTFSNDVVIAEERFFR